MDKLFEQMWEVLKTNAKEAGVELKANAKEVKEYMSGIVTKLKGALQEPDYPRALRAARDDMALFVTNESIDSADSIDGRILGALESGLAIIVAI